MRHGQVRGSLSSIYLGALVVVDWAMPRVQRDLVSAGEDSVSSLVVHRCCCVQMDPPESLAPGCSYPFSYAHTGVRAAPTTRQRAMFVCMILIVHGSRTAGSSWACDLHEAGLGPESSPSASDCHCGLHGAGD